MTATRTLMPVAITVEETFAIAGQGLVLVPSLPLPKEGTFLSFVDDVTLRRPDGTTVSTRASFSMTHSLIRGGVGRWDIVVALPTASKADVPTGTQVHVSNEVMATLAGHRS